MAREETRKQRRWQEIAAMTAMVNEVTGCTKDDDKDKVRRGKVKQDEGR